MSFLLFFIVQTTFTIKLINIIDTSMAMICANKIHHRLFENYTHNDQTKKIDLAF